MSDIPLYLQYIALGVLLVCSAFFSIAETSMMALNRYRLKAMVRMGRRGAQRTADLLERIDRLLGVILLGNNLINAAAATLTGVIATQLFGEEKFVLLIGTLAITFLILVFAEITPKVVGAAYAERIAPIAAYVLGPLLRVLYPVVWFINLFVNGLLRLLRIKPASDPDSQRMSPEELRMLVLEHSRFLPRKHQSILMALFDLERITVEDVMIPRSRIESIDLDASAEELTQKIATSHHTRLIAYRGEPGNVVGILHLRRAFAATEAGVIDKDLIEALVTAPYFVPAPTPVLSQLQYFQENRQRVGLVVDEYGELLGLVTLEDIVEELVGEFTTGTPLAPGAAQWGADGSALVEGAASLRELNRRLNLTLPIDGPKTLNGLLLEHLEDIPESGVSVQIGRVRMEVVQTQDRVIKTVRLFQPIAQVPAANSH